MLAIEAGIESVVVPHEIIFSNGVDYDWGSDNWVS